MKALLQAACHQVNRSQGKALSAAACKALRKRYRTILTQAGQGIARDPATRPGPTRTDRQIRCPQPARAARQARSGRAALPTRSGCEFHQQCRRARTANVQSENEGVGLLSNESLRRGLCTHLQLPAVHGRARPQSSRRHPNRARRPRCRHGQSTLWPDTNRGLSSYRASIESSIRPDCKASVLTASICDWTAATTVSSPRTTGCTNSFRCVVVSA